MSANTEHLRSLEPLLGTWKVEGPGTSGTVQYAWPDFDGWMLQHIRIVAGTQPTRGLELIGYDAETGTLRSRFFGSGGELLEYTYVLEGRVLTIYHGGTDSPAKFVGTFNDDFTVNTGAWSWPGGGYESTMTKQTEGSDVPE
ncbi:hypothetical protein [Kribbella sp. CA-247076]|uniref:hypothetical protein n=1 Tax=Kribbella sp. CA-247076 TaxID=3239941 RepID=UPI003D8F2B1D